VASVRGKETGYLAVVRIGDKIGLLAGRGTLSTRLRDQIEICTACEGKDSPTDTIQLDAAVRDIHDWIENHAASSAAGLADSASSRKSLLQRIDNALLGAPPHLRPLAAGVADKARRIATATLGAAAEKELDCLARCSVTDDQLISAVSSIELPGVEVEQDMTRLATRGILALLLVKAG
jgi:hypothetical protein